jgi:putative salt-induced outer membrane protein
MPFDKSFARTARLGALAAAATVAGGAVSTSAQEAAAKPPDTRWQTSAAIGFTYTSGNSKNLLFTGNILGVKKWDKNELSLGADASYGESDGTKNTENYHAFGQYNRLFNDRFYGYGRLDALHDDIADVNYRISLGVGAGYYFIKNAKTTLSGEAGPSVVFEEQGGISDTYAGIRLAERLEHKFNDKVRLWQSLEWIDQVDELDNWILNAEVGVEASLSAKMSLRTYIQDTYDHQPAAGRLKNDFKLITALAYKF